MKSIGIFTVFLLALFSPIAQAVEYSCAVTKKLNSEHEYTSEEITKGQFSVLIEDSGLTSYLSRCSFAGSAGKVACDRYEVDEVAKNEEFHDALSLCTKVTLYIIRNTIDKNLVIMTENL